MTEKKRSIFKNVQLGLGTWQWGDRLVWNYGQGYSDKDIEETFAISLENGIRFFDTAEVYGQGKSELHLGKLLKTTNEPVIIATKFMPYPWRLRKNAMRKALTGSLKRLDLPRVDLYQIHMPFPPVSIHSWMEEMLDLQKDDLIVSVGVSNYNLDQMNEAIDTLDKGGSKLASNQVEYNLLERRIETNGVMQKCNELGIKVIAYSPLAMGILSGKYTPENPPKGVRSSQYNRNYLELIQPLIRMMKKIGMNHDGKTASQVAINWVICKGAIPIPGAKNANQLEQNIGALGWKLTEEEVATLDELSDSVSKRG
jgi:aryl-alcohol dehydrogenase-like predicted oxidoreductase